MGKIYKLTIEKRSEGNLEIFYLTEKGVFEKDSLTKITEPLNYSWNNVKSTFLSTVEGTEAKSLKDKLF